MPLIRKYVKLIKSLISSDVYDTTQMRHYVKWLLCMSCINIENTTLQIVTYRRPHHILAYAYLVDMPVCDVADGIVKYSAHTAVQSFVLFHIVTYICQIRPSNSISCDLDVSHSDVQQIRRYVKQLIMKFANTSKLIN